MIFWPFRRRRSRRTAKHASRSRSPLAEKSVNVASQPPATNPASKSMTPFSRRSSRRSSWRSRRHSQKLENPAEEIPPLPTTASAPIPISRGKQSARPTNDSIENITALPDSRALQSSPHLRPVDLTKPAIPYNFRPHSTSLNSVQSPTSDARPHSNSVNPQRTSQHGTPSRTTSRASKKDRRQNDALREEQIRAMSATMPVPKRPGDGPLRQDSKKLRGSGVRGSAVSLPPEGSIHSTMSGLLEQRGWEVGGLELFNPRPVVRLSGSPQYVAPGTIAPSAGFLYRIDSVGARDKTPVTDKQQKRRTIGQDTADELGTSDLRVIMERDAKRRARKEKERHEKLQRKLQARADERDQQRQDDRQELQAELSKLRAERGLLESQPLTPPADVHPALRGPMLDMAAVSASEAGPAPRDELADDANPLNPFRDNDANQPRNPFTDAAILSDSTPVPRSPQSGRPFITPLETPSEMPLLEAALDASVGQSEVQVPSPPISPLRSPLSFASESHLSTAYRKSSLSQATPTGTPLDSPIEGAGARKPGAWASIFRRGNTNSRRSAILAKSPASQTSFSNTSRESMRGQPLPAHLVDPQARRPSATRSISGTPVRTQSKFREDLPELPLSPPDSRNQSPDITTMAAAAAAARRAKRGQPSAGVEPPATVRSDTPVSPILSGNDVLSESMASVGSEASWLASGEHSRKRQSALDRSLSKRTADNNASYEELAASAGADRDAEYMARNSTSRRASGHISTIADESNAGEDMTDPAIDPTITDDDPLTVHDSVRRKPTIVHRGPAVRSREGLLTDFESSEAEPALTSTTTAGAAPRSVKTEGSESPPDSDEFEQDIAFQDAVKVHTVDRRHSRQFSAGSARLLDLAGRRSSIDRGA